MPVLPWYPWWPMDAMASFAGLTDELELALRRAFDRSWLEGHGGVGTLDQWRAWGCLESEEFDREVRRRCQVQDDGLTWVHMRMARVFCDQSLARERSARGGRNSAAQRGLKGGSSTLEGHLKYPSTNRTEQIRTEESKNTRRTRSRRSGPESEPDGFLPFYDRYPRKIARRAAAKAFAAALKRHPKYTPKLLLEGCQAFLEALQDQPVDEKFIPHPATWLNEDRFREYFDEEAPDDPAETNGHPEPED